MNEKTKRFIKSKFQDYYRTAEIHLPPDFTSREWGFILFDEMPEFVMRRHKAFGSQGELQDYLSGMVPAHAYYSVAYYEYPNAPKMKEKNWLSADLIFDLDADHLPGAPKSYADMLEHVKQESLKLYGFLNNDFGFAEEDIHIVFSGGRGYHFHIGTPAVRSLGSAERREIVDYVSGRGLNSSTLYKKILMHGGDCGAGTQVYKGQMNSESKWVLDNYDTGWGKKVAEYIVKYLHDESMKDDKEMFKDLRQMDNFGKKTLKKMKKLASNEEMLQDILEKGRLDFRGFSENKFKEIIDYFIKQSIKEHGVLNSGSETQVDEPVTADIKRLIRLPGSLHGGSGMRVVALSISELETFDPFNDAVVFSDESVQLKVIKPFSVQMKGNEFVVEPGDDTIEIPEYAAIYLMCRGAAEYGSK